MQLRLSVDDLRKMKMATASQELEATLSPSRQAHGDDRGRGGCRAALQERIRRESLDG